MLYTGKLWNVKWYDTFKNFKYFYISGREALLLVEEYREKVYYTEIV